MFGRNPTTGYQGYQPDIKALCASDIMSCHPFGPAQRPVVAPRLLR